MTKLSVNINKIATLRNARGENNPDLLKMALLIESFGADGITVHPRPDERHIKKSDVIMLKKHLHTEFNIEGFPSRDFIELINNVKPTQVTLVPDPPGVLTSNAGFNLKNDFNLVFKSVEELRPSGARIAIFLDPKDFIGRDVSVIKDSGVDRIELYTKEYADHSLDAEILHRYRKMAEQIKDLGLGINAGHDLSLENLHRFLKALPFVDEVSIGHALICDALILGLEETLRRYLNICAGHPALSASHANNLAASGDDNHTANPSDLGDIEYATH